MVKFCCALQSQFFFFLIIITDNRDNQSGASKPLQKRTKLDHVIDDGNSYRIHDGSMAFVCFIYSLKKI